MINGKIVLSFSLFLSSFFSLMDLDTAYTYIYIYLYRIDGRLFNGTASDCDKDQCRL